MPEEELRKLFNKNTIIVEHFIKPGVEIRRIVNGIGNK